MNDLLKAYAKQNIKEGLAKCTPKQVMFFKRMYSHENLDADIESVVNNLPEKKLDWAMLQVQNTIKQNTQQALKEAEKE